MSNFNPNAQASKDSGIFGLPYSTEEAKLVLLPIPWEATTSYGGGTSLGPQAIFHASKQIDLFDIELGNFFAAGIAMLPESRELQTWNQQARQAALTVIEAAGEHSAEINQALAEVNQYSEKVNTFIYNETKKLLSEHKYVGLVGGDHSCAYAIIQAHVEKYPDMSVLHFDAHADMRDAYEGFEHSHASVMYNVLERTALKKLVQVGIRDFCEEELAVMNQYPERVKTYFDFHLAEKKMQGTAWAKICEKIVANLSTQVYISFDIDGLDPRFCPHTGTPVPGGLDFNEALYLIKLVVKSGRKIIGFDLNEVSPGMVEDVNNLDTASEWDANVGARLLYKLCGWTLQSK
ncbi:MAG: N(1)-aminopropylagmatine ureohydrolase [Gammaproteobacteria bacterium]|jgi:agmatinase|nr:N(1)-aminopropylagmatine ureohydrolase [Gammaproteobacteria bacterium]